MDIIICSNCRKEFDTDAEDIQETEIDVCPMDTGDARYETAYHCPHCGYANIYCYADKPE